MNLFIVFITNNIFQHAMQTAAQKLCELVGKKYLIFTERGNKAIKLSLEILRMQGQKQILIQDQGGWLTYPQFAEKLEFEKIEVKTDFGLVDTKDLESNKNSVLLINSILELDCIISEFEIGSS